MDNKFYRKKLKKNIRQKTYFDNKNYRRKNNRLKKNWQNMIR